MYTKIHIYGILYKSCSIKQIIFNKYEANLEPENLRFAPIIILNFHIAELIHAILLHIVRIVCMTSPGTSANGSAVSLSRNSDGNHVTSTYVIILYLV